jgi:hypothetical protein
LKTQLYVRWTGSSDPHPHNGASGSDGKDDQDQEALLFVSSSDAVVVWRLTECYAAAAEGAPQREPVLLMSMQGQVDALAVGVAAQILVVCAGIDVYVFDLWSLRNTFRCVGGVKLSLSGADR